MLSMLLFAFAAATAAPPLPAAPAAPACRLPSVVLAGKRNPVARPQKLGEQPPATHYLAVVRQIGGCPEPAIVRTGIGGR